MMKPIIRLKWRPEKAYERLDLLIVALALFASACAIAADYSHWYSLLVSGAFSVCLLLLVRYRASKLKSILLSAASLSLLLLLLAFPDVPLYCFLLILYPLLLIFALINTNPRLPFAAGLLSSLFLFRYQGQMVTAELWANIFAVQLNALVYSLLTHMMRKLLKERNEYRHLSMIDSLTGLHSLQQTMIFGQRLIDKGHKVRVLLIDLDHFKQINDTYGHMIGNQVIVHFASSLRKLMEGANGVVGRLGGDEFVLVLEEKEDSSELLDHIESRLNHTRYVPGVGLEPLMLSFSIGEAVSDPHSTTHMEQLMHSADLHMYDFKLRKRVPLIHTQSEQLFEHNPDPICSFDYKGKLLDLNPAAEKLLGYSVEELKDWPFTTLIDEQDYEVAMEHYYSFTEKGSPSDYDISVISSNGTLVPIHVTIIPIIANHKIAGFYALAKDRTAQIKEEERRRQAEKLEIMTRMAARFEEGLRAPLAVVAGFNQLLMEQDKERFPYYAAMRQELERMTFLLQEGKMLSASIPPPEGWHHPVVLIREAMSILEAKALLAKIDWELTDRPDIPNIRCQREQVRLALVHVLSNAIEAMPHGGCIQVHCERQEGAVAIRIHDQGAAMEEDQLGRIGELLYTTKPNGSGIGLRITMRVMQNHKGTILLCHDPDHGMTVELKLLG